MGEKQADEDKSVQIFLSYARFDEEKVEDLYQKLSNAGLKPWMAKKDILPGERWESCIQKAIQQSDFFLACLSANSVNRRGFLQREIKDALDVWQKMLEDDIFLIPVRLEDCEVPESLRGFQWVNLFEEDGWSRLVKAIQVGIERRAEVPADEEPFLVTDVTVQVTVLLEGNIQEFTPIERESFIFALSRVVNVGPNQIRILRVAPGSVQVTLEMPEEAAQLLVSMYLDGEPVLKKLRIVKVELQQVTAPPDISRRKVESIESLQRQLTIHGRNLNRLEERKAIYGINIPLEISNQIDYEEKEIQRIEQELQAFSVEPVKVEMAREPRSFLLARKVCQVPKAIIEQYGENIVLLPNASMEFLGISHGSIVGVRNRLTGRIRFAFASSVNRVCDVSIPQVLRSRLGVSLSSTNDLEIFAAERRTSVLVQEVCKAPKSKINIYGQNVIVLSTAVAEVLDVGEGGTIKVVNKRNAREKPVTVCSVNRVCEVGIPKVLRRTLGVQLGETNELELRRV